MKRRAQFLQWTYPFLLKDLIHRNGIDHEKIYLLLNELDSYEKNFNTDRKKQTNKQTNRQTDNQDMRHFFWNVELELRVNNPPDKIYVIRGNEC